MKKLLLIMLGILLFSLSSCEKAPTDYLAKTVWEGPHGIVKFGTFVVEGLGTLEFLGNGKVVWVFGSTIEGTYSIIDENNVTFNLSKKLSAGTMWLVKASVYVSKMEVTVASTYEGASTERTIIFDRKNF